MTTPLAVKSLQPATATPRHLAGLNISEDAIRSLTSSLISRIRIVESRNLTGADGRFDGVEVTRLAIAPGLSDDELQQNIAVVDRSLQPAPYDVVAKLIAKLAARTKTRAQGEGEARLTAATMVEDLRQYPIDVAEFACTHWIEGGRDAKWFPSWPELREICERRVQGRRQLKREIERLLMPEQGCIASTGAPEPIKRLWDTVEAERAIRQRLAEMGCGFYFDRWREQLKQAGFYDDDVVHVVTHEMMRAKAEDRRDDLKAIADAVGRHRPKAAATPMAAIAHAARAARRHAD